MSSDQNNNQPHSAEELAKIAEQVQQRAKDLTKNATLPPTVDDKFVDQCLNNNERGDGCMYATYHRNRFIYNVSVVDAKREEWYVWKEHCWRLDKLNESLAGVEDIALRYEVGLDRLNKEISEGGIDKNHPDAWKLKHRDKYKARCDRLRKLSGINNARKYAPIVDHSLACHEEDFDKQPWLLPVKNGVIDLQTGLLNDGRPEDLLTRQLDIDYDPHADYTQWQDFIDQVTGDPEVAAFIKRSLGYAITGFSFEQYIWIFIGPGRNGKGTMFDLFGDIMGPYYHEISRALLLEQRNEPSPAAASEHLYSLLRKRIIVGAETNKGQKIDPGAVKSLTGENKIKCRPNFKSEINFSPTHATFLDTNNFPYGLTKEFSLTERLLIINFPFRYVDDIEESAKKYPTWATQFRQKDKHLKKKLREIKPAILKWLVEGCLEWQEIGLSPPPSILGAVDTLAKSEDYLGEFLADSLVHEPDHELTRISTTNVYDAFRWWWSQNKDTGNHKRPALQTITKEFRERGYTIEKKSGRYWLYMYQLNPDIENDVRDFVANNPVRS